MLAFLSFCAAETCKYSIKASDQLRISSYNLTKGECVDVTVPNSSYYTIATSDKDIEISRYVRVSDSDDYILEFLGRTPEASLIGRSEPSEHLHVYTALSSVSFALVYGSLSQFKCDFIVLDSHNPLTFSMSKGELEGVTCVLSATPGAQSIDGTLGQCESCPTIDVWDGNTQNLVHFTEAFHFTETSRHGNVPLVVVITPNTGAVTDFDTFTFRVQSNASQALRPSSAIFGSVSDVMPPEPQVLVYEMGNTWAYAGIGVLGFVLLILVTVSIQGECKRKRKNKEKMLLSSSTQVVSTRYMATDIGTLVDKY